MFGRLEKEGFITGMSAECTDMRHIECGVFLDLGVVFSWSINCVLICRQETALMNENRF